MRCAPVSTSVEGALPWFRLERVVTTEQEYRESFEALSEAVTGQYFELPIVMKPTPFLEARVGIPDGPLQVGPWQFHATSSHLVAFVPYASTLDATGPAVNEEQALEKAHELAKRLPWVGPEAWRLRALGIVDGAGDQVIGRSWLIFGWRRIRGVTVDRFRTLDIELLSNGTPARVSVPLDVVRAVGSAGAEQPCDAVGWTTPLDADALQTRFEQDVLSRAPASETFRGAFSYRSRGGGQLFEPVFSADWLPVIPGSRVVSRGRRWTVRADGAGAAIDD